jgi:prepilin-type N-terminal cleavage/methylation domain-containing protein/prepilin-type processing-associated H-X9-DG protein
MRRRRGAGFTLVELLVVVSIIALLIAILLPSLKKARSQAKDLVCKGNLRSMGQAFMMYAEKYDGVWPSTMDVNNGNRWPVPFHRGRIITAELARFDDAGQQTKAPEPSVFLCPEERAPRIIPDWKPSGMSAHPVDRVEVGGSYGMTEEVHRKDGRLQRGSVGTPPHLNKIDTCRRASEVFAVLDNYAPLKNTSSPGWRFNRGTDIDSSGNFTASGGAFWLGYRDRVSGEPLRNVSAAVEATRLIGNRHSGRGNGLCVDGHVEGYNPLTLPYNRISWERWKSTSELPFGGI